MYKNKSIIGIIPARSGSKGLPHKNIRPFMGKPLMAWTIIAARKSGVLDEIFVSTDSSQYAVIAAQYGAEPPFLRPPELSGDDSPASGYIIHALRSYRERLGKTFDYFALLQPTTPLRTAGHIRDGVAAAVDGGLASVVSFSPFDTDLRLVCALPEDMGLALFESPNDTLRQFRMEQHAPHGQYAPEQQAQERQAPHGQYAPERLYRVNGMLYVSRCDAYEATKSFYGPNGKAMIINGASCTSDEMGVGMDVNIDLDIDNENDFLYAEFLAKRSGRFE
ncbi:MAG: acylneuraminate cytidylyltransferase family protein [Oscillospiraceae bacterium]|nr:acylneuraminate cytidylyltransferase family protein [Oscillospiraceae bacterium]